MPTTMLTLAWLVIATTHLVATPGATATVAGTSPVSAVNATAPRPAPLSIIGLPAGDEQGQRDWLLLESENDEETDDTDEFGISLPLMSWPEARSLFGFVRSNPHPTILPQSALRSLVLRS